MASKKPQPRKNTGPNSSKPGASSKQTSKPSKDAKETKQDSTSTSKKSAPTGSRREQLRQQQAKQDRERRIRTIVTLSIVGVALAAIVTALVIFVVPMLTKKSQVASGGSDSKYVVKVGNSDAPAVVDVYLDYMCPYCGNFERTNSEDIKSMTTDGKALVQIHPLAFLDDASQGTEYSSRAANAFVTVANKEPDKVLAFNAILFENQPDEQTTGLTDAEIAQLAQKVGVSTATTDTFTDNLYADWVAKGTTDAFKSEGIESTPTVKINGKAVESADLFTAGKLKSDVEKAGSGQ